VDQPYPRVTAFRTSPEYAAIARKTSDTLMAAMGNVEMEAEA
jgi:hypothetical protein